MTTPSPFKTLGSRIAYQNPWMQVREDNIVRPDGSEGMYGVVETKDSVIIVAANENNDICLINMFRYPVQKWGWELPGGGSEGKDTLEAAKRELIEETGLTAKDWQVLGSTRDCNGLMSEHQLTLLAKGLTYDKATDKVEGIAEMAFFSLEDIDALIDSGAVDDGQSIASLYLYKKWLAKQKNSE